MAVVKFWNALFQTDGANFVKRTLPHTFAAPLRDAKPSPLTAPVNCTS